MLIVSILPLNFLTMGVFSLKFSILGQKIFREKNFPKTLNLRERGNCPTAMKPLLQISLQSHYNTLAKT